MNTYLLVAYELSDGISMTFIVHADTRSQAIRKLRSRAKEKGWYFASLHSHDVSYECIRIDNLLPQSIDASR